MTKISPLLVGEAAAAAALWEEAGLVRPWNDPQADVVAALTCPTAVILAAREIGRITGTVMAGYDGHRGWLYYLAVANDRRGTGVGQALTKAAEEWLARRGARAIRLMVRPDNEPVTGFYRKLGYEDAEMIVMGKRLG
jgi:ribosomal protein S18 acetylase RimI-like enzyme